jgi:hypothetical protein
MGMDIRVPLGAMFALLGLLLTAFGVFGNKAIYAQTLGIDVNRDWGIVLLIFGAIMLYLGLRSPVESESPAEDGDADQPRAGQGH